MKKNVFRISTLGMLFALGSLNAQEQTEKLEKLDEVVIVATKFAIEKEKIDICNWWGGCQICSLRNAIHDEPPSWPRSL